MLSLETEELLEFKFILYINERISELEYLKNS